MWWTVVVPVAAGEVAGPRADAGMETAASGMTWATAAFAASRCASAADTVAATELTSVNCLMPVAWTSLSSVSRADRDGRRPGAGGRGARDGLAELVLQDHDDRSVDVLRELRGQRRRQGSEGRRVGRRGRGPGRGRDHGRGHAAEHDGRGGHGGGHGKNGQELAFRHVFPSPRQRLCLAAARATLPEFVGHCGSVAKGYALVSMFIRNFV